MLHGGEFGSGIAEQPEQVSGSETGDIWDNDEFNEAMGSFDYSDIPDGESAGSFLSVPGECISIIFMLNACSYVDALEQPETVSENGDVITAAKPQPAPNTYAGKHILQFSPVAVPT